MPVVREETDTVQHVYTNTFKQTEQRIRDGWHIYSIHQTSAGWQFDLFKYIDS